VIDKNIILLSCQRYRKRQIIINILNNKRTNVCGTNACRSVTQPSLTCPNPVHLLSITGRYYIYYYYYYYIDQNGDDDNDDDDDGGGDDDRTHDFYDRTHDFYDRTNDFYDRTHDFYDRTHDFYDRTHGFYDRTYDLIGTTEQYNLKKERGLC